MEIELKACPFCGKKEPVEMMTADGKNGYRNRYFVLCCYYIGGCGAAGGVYHTKVEAADAWNERTEEKA